MSTLRIRPPVCADDRWYPSDAGQLSAWLAEFLGNVPEQPKTGELIGLIAPHAGYAYSGQTAAYSYRQLQGRPFTRVVVLGPSHYEDLGPRAVNASNYYQTPLGEIEIDADWVKRLDHQVGVRFVERDHEHSLEMQLPFLQQQLQTFKLVPLMLSRPFYVFGPAAYPNCQELGAALGSMLDDETLLVASSDLSHLHDYEAVTHFDQNLQTLIEQYDLPALVAFLANEGECRACGDVGIVTLLLAAQARGANKVRVLYRTNSGDVTGLREQGSYTVGYMAAGVYRDP